MSTRGSTRLLISASMLTVAGCLPALAVECQVRPDEHGLWTWRYIQPRENARCWYRGRHILPKSQLHWPRPEADGNGNKLRKPPLQTDKLQPVGDNADYNYIDAHADDPVPLVDLDEARPFGPWEERVGGQFAGAIAK